MAASSPIEWTDATWNPVTGCDKVSPGCAHCYAERMARRLQAMGQRNYADGFAVRTHEHMLEHPLRWKRPLGPDPIQWTGWLSWPGLRCVE